MTNLRTAAQQALEALLTPSGAQACSTCQNGPENEYCCRMEMWSAITALRAALAQRVKPDHETRAELAEQQVVQLAEERDHYRNLWQKAQQDEPLNLADPAVRKRLATQWGYVPAAQAEPDLFRCPRCNGPADNGFDRSIPPSPYLCTKCMAEPVEPVAWKQGNLVTFNEDPCPVLGGLFMQSWDGEEVAARVYANDLKTLRQRCAKVNTAPPQRKPLTEEEIVDAVREAEMESRKLERFAALVAAAEREACAALLEANGMRCGEESLSRLILETNASAIRARNNT